MRDMPGQSTTDPPQTYAVNYNANDGINASGNAPLSQIKTQGVPLTLSSQIPTREGYTFKGWATTSTAVAAQYQPGGIYNADAAATLWAVWESNISQPTQYTLTFNTGGGSTIAPITVNAGTAINLPASTKEGFAFKGWATSNGGGVTYQAGASYAVNGNATLFAVWEENNQPPPQNGIFGTNPRWYGAWWHYILFFIGFGFIWMWF